jgi:mannose-6-phosphate isomerase-like protein (cupin superfamily)
MTVPLRYLRIFADAVGESQANECELAMSTSQFAPPAPPLELSATHATDRLAILRLPSNWQGDWHPSPYRQWLFFLSGTASIEVGSGNKYEVAPGSIVLLEDTQGRGHRTLASETGVVIASVRVSAGSNA